MPKARLWGWERDGQVLTGPQVCVKGNMAERDNDLHVGQQLEFSEEVWLTVLDFLALGFIRRGRTVEHLRDKTVVQRQTIVAMRSRGLTGKSMRV